MFMSCHQNAAQNYNLMVGSKSFKNVAEFKYLKTTVTRIAFLKKLRED
jgi:hypothetical protein